MHQEADHTASLSGWAWADSLGWISMSSTTNDNNTQTGGVTTAPGSQTNSDYGVSIDTEGYFRGYAWSETGGWVSFYEDINTFGYTRTTWRSNQGPNTPNMDLPADNTNLNDNTPTFQFDLSDSDGTDLIHYQIQIDNNSDFGSVEFDITES